QYQCQVRGDVDRSLRVDILDIDYFIDWLHRGGPAPLCLEEADVDGNNQQDILDIDYMVGYLYRHGPAPLPCP
ncbi:MAG: hypothetical protein JSV52_04370, partial [Candidatus Zixiibacteriota bacterium]